MLSMWKMVFGDQPATNETKEEYKWQKVDPEQDADTNPLSYKNISWEQILEEMRETGSDFDSAFEKEDWHLSSIELLRVIDQMNGALEHLKFHYNKDVIAIDEERTLYYQTKLNELSDLFKDFISIEKKLPTETRRFEKEMKEITRQKDLLNTGLQLFRKLLNPEKPKASATPKPSQIKDAPYRTQLVTPGTQRVDVAAKITGPRA